VRGAYRFNSKTYIFIHIHFLICMLPGFDLILFLTTCVTRIKCHVKRRSQPVYLFFMDAVDFGYFMIYSVNVICSLTKKYIHHLVIFNILNSYKNYY